MALGAATTYEVPVELVLGWVPFLWRLPSRISWAGGTVAVSAAALLLFTAGVHVTGRSWRRRTGAGSWKLRWSLAGVAAMFVLFTAGVCLIGVTHQVAWLSASEEPLLGETLRSSLGRSSHLNLRLIGSAAWTHQDSAGTFPSGATFTPDGGMLHSWETQLLPYLWYSSREIDLTVPWNDPKNVPYFRSVLPDFINPEFRPAPLTDLDGFGLSHYAANSRVMGPNRAMKVQDITDGTANTILVGEVNANFKPWGHPVNWRDPARGINQSPNGFGGPRSSGGAQFLMADGSVRLINERVSPGVLRALATPDGKEDVDPSDLENPR
jgi:prepilin-type processing-associated H-X9-DG protein